MALRADEMDHHYRMEKLRSRTVITRAVIRGVTIAIGCICLVFFVRAIAGRQTFADVRFRVLADLEANKFFSLTTSWIFGTGGVSWAVVERRLRKRITKRLTKENRELQTLIDPGRLSSGLMPNGDTRPEDE